MPLIVFFGIFKSFIYLVNTRNMERKKQFSSLHFVFSKAYFVSPNNCRSDHRNINETSCIILPLQAFRQVSNPLNHFQIFACPAYRYVGLNLTIFGIGAAVFSWFYKIEACWNSYIGDFVIRGLQVVFDDYIIRIVCYKRQWVNWAAILMFFQRHSTADWCTLNHVAAPCGVVCIFACGHQLYLEYSRITVDYNPIYMLWRLER
jgi:hypothetical protein